MIARRAEAIAALNSVLGIQRIDELADTLAEVPALGPDVWAGAEGAPARQEAPSPTKRRWLPGAGAAGIGRLAAVGALGAALGATVAALLVSGEVRQVRVPRAQTGSSLPQPSPAAPAKRGAAPRLVERLRESLGAESIASRVARPVRLAGLGAGAAEAVRTATHARARTARARHVTASAARRSGAPTATIAARTATNTSASPAPTKSHHRSVHGSRAPDARAPARHDKRTTHSALSRSRPKHRSAHRKSRGAHGVSKKGPKGRGGNH